MFLVGPFLYKKCPPFVQARISLLCRDLLSLEAEICINSDEEGMQEPVRSVRSMLGLIECQCCTFYPLELAPNLSVNLFLGVGILGKVEPAPLALCPKYHHLHAHVHRISTASDSAIGGQFIVAILHGFNE